MDASIEITCGPGSSLEGSRFSFASCPVTLGRQPGNDIVFDAHKDRVVSGQHAELRFEGGEIRLHDLGSSNGTFVNGRRIDTPVVLSVGDRISLGRDGATLHVYSPRMQHPAQHPAQGSAPNDTARSPGHDTIVAMVSDATARERHRGRSLALTLTAATVVLAAGLIAGAVWFFQGGAQEVMEDVARREARLAARTEAENAARGISRSIDEKLATASRGFRDVFPRVEKSVFPVFRRKRIQGTEWTLSGGGTCWVVGEGVLATNAHVAVNHRPGTSKLILRAGDPEREIEVQRVEVHPGYRIWSNLLAEVRPIDPGKMGFMRLVPACDVALMWTREADAEHLGDPLEIADAEQLHQLDRGAPAALLGFPVEGIVVGSLERAKATSEVGTISQVFDYFLESNDGPLEQLVTYNLKGGGGASGSPVFNRHGRVVAVHSAGNYKFVSSQRISQGSTSFGQRADLVRQLLEGRAEECARQLERLWRRRLLDLWSKVRDSNATLLALRGHSTWPGRNVGKTLLQRGSIAPGRSIKVSFTTKRGRSWSVAVMVTGSQFGKLGLRGSVQSPAYSWVTMARGRRSGSQSVEVYQPSTGTHRVSYELWLLRAR